MITLSEDQKTIHDAAMEWFKGKKPKDITIGGYAGTGKSTVTAEMAKTLRAKNPKLRIAFACFTGKAAYVLQSKLVAAEAVDINRDYVGTIHGLMYRPVVVDGIVVKWKRVDAIEADLLIIDEASMVGEQIYKDLRHYKIPIIAVGDHGQLPPIGGNFNLMGKPDHTLTKIHRQAEGNPIIQISREIRETGCVNFGEYLATDGSGAYVKKIKKSILDVTEGVKDLDNSLFLCGRNATRKKVNQAVRDRYGFGGEKPMVGERLICLKNNREVGIFNGMCGTLRSIAVSGEHWYKAKIDMEDSSTYEGLIIKDQFGADATLREHPKLDPVELKDLFDFGYCLTVHKSQGSEAENVVLFEERFSQSTDEDWRRWLYTAVTRARKRLLIVGHA